MEAKVEQAAQGFSTPQASPLAAAGGYGDDVHLLQGMPGILQQVPHHGHEGAGVGEAAVLAGLGQQGIVPAESRRAGGGRGLQR